MRSMGHGSTYVHGYPSVKSAVWEANALQRDCKSGRRRHRAYRRQLRSCSFPVSVGRDVCCDDTHLNADTRWSISPRARRTRRHDRGVRLFGCNLWYVTPMAYQTNLLIVGAAGYTFRDFVRVGAPLALIMITALAILPVRNFNM